MRILAPWQQTEVAEEKHYQKKKGEKEFKLLESHSFFLSC